MYIFIYIEDSSVTGKLCEGYETTWPIEISALGHFAKKNRLNLKNNAIKALSHGLSNAEGGGGGGYVTL